MDYLMKLGYTSGFQIGYRCSGSGIREKELSLIIGGIRCLHCPFLLGGKKNKLSLACLALSPSLFCYVKLWVWRSVC